MSKKMSQTEIESDTDQCRNCGIELGAGYLCDDCDEVVIDR